MSEIAAPAQEDGVPHPRAARVGIRAAREPHSIATQICHLDRSRSVCHRDRSMPSRTEHRSQFVISTGAQLPICHLDRSEAKWRDLLAPNETAKRLSHPTYADKRLESATPADLSTDRHNHFPSISAVDINEVIYVNRSDQREAHAGICSVTPGPAHADFCPLKLQPRLLITRSTWAGLHAW